MKMAVFALAVTLLPAAAQEIKMPASLDALAAKADEAVTVTMDKSMLQLAARFLNDKEGGERDVRNLVAGLDSIYVRNFVFKQEGAYSMTDVDAVRDQLKGPTWGRLVGVRSKSGENVDVYFKDGGNGTLGGVVVLAAEPKELTVVNIIGKLDPERLADLGGEFGIPHLEKSETHREPR